MSGMAGSYLLGVLVVPPLIEFGGWRLSFLGYMFPLSLIALILVSLSIPKTLVNKNPANLSETRDGFKSVFNNKSALASLLGYLFGMVMWASLSYVIAYLREIHQISVGESSLVLLMGSLVYVLGSLTSTRLAAHFGRKKFVSITISIAGILLMIIPFSQLVLMVVGLFGLICMFVSWMDTSSTSLIIEQDLKYPGIMMALQRVTSMLGSSIGSGLDAVFDFMLDGSLATSKCGWKWEDVIYDLGMRLTDIAHQDFAIHCKKVEDIEYAFKTGKIAHIFCTKAAPIENEIDRIDILHGLGIRVLGVTYSQSNMLGIGENDNDLGAGLTDFGYDCVIRMNKIGMLIDIGHCADQTCLDVIEYSKKPVTASHNVPSTIARGHTNPDEVLIALAEKGGVMGINGGGGGERSLGTVNHPAGGLEGNMECMEYCIKLMGIDHVGFGIDSMYGDHRKAGGSILPNGRANRPSKSKEVPLKSPLRAPKFPGFNDPNIDPGYSKGLENPSDNINQIKWLVKHGYSDKEIIKLMGGNALRLLKTVW